MEAPAPKQPRKVQWWKDWRLFFFNSYSTCLQKRKRSEKSSKKVNYWNVQTRKGIIGCIGWSWIVKKERWRRSRCWGIIVGVALSALVNCGSSSILGCRVKMEMERRAMSLLDLLERRIMMNTKIVFKNKGTSWFLQYHLLFFIDSDKQKPTTLQVFVIAALSWTTATIWILSEIWIPTQCHQESDAERRKYSHKSNNGHCDGGHFKGVCWWACRDR